MPRQPLSLGLAIACLASAAALADPPQPAQPAKLELRFRFQPGAETTYRLTVEQTLEIGNSLAAGEVQRLRSRLAADTRQKVLSVGEGGAVIELGFGKPEASTNVQGVEMPVAGLDELPRLRLTMRMSDRGQLGEVETLIAPDLPPEVQRLAAELKKSLAQNAIVFPDHPLAPGESWSEERAVPAGLPGAEGVAMVMKATYTLRGMEKALGRACARIDSRVVLGLKGRLMQGGLPVDADLKGQGQGQACFSLEEGRLVRTQAGLSVDGTLQASQRGQAVSTTLKLTGSLIQELR